MPRQAPSASTRVVLPAHGGPHTRITPHFPSSSIRSTDISRRAAARVRASAFCSEMSACTLKAVASSANCRQSRFSDSAASARRASSSAARRSACSARSADMSD